MTNYLGEDDDLDDFLELEKRITAEDPNAVRQFAQMMKRLDVENAYNLDGGNSTMVMFKGEYVNRINEETMRTISDIIYFASAYQGEQEAGQ